jgi:hypothetical protein
MEEEDDDDDDDNPRMTSITTGVRICNASF